MNEIKAKFDWRDWVGWGYCVAVSLGVMLAVTIYGCDTPAEAPPPEPPPRMSWNPDSWTPSVHVLTDHKTGREYIVVQDSKGIAICPAQEAKP